MRSRNPSPSLSSLGFFLLLSIALLIFDKKSPGLDVVKSTISLINIPIEYITGSPRRVYDLFTTFIVTSKDAEKLVALERENAVLLAQQQRFDALEKENQRLSSFRLSSNNSFQNMLLTEVSNVRFEPYSHKIVIKQGSESGVYKGQTAITPKGVLGQVSSLGYKRSVVIAITDPTHSIPIEVLRSGLRTIAQGSGDSNFVNVLFLEAQTNIRIGDILITSGLGNKFPQGYKVAEVVDIINDASQAFLTIKAKTFVKFNTVREVLLIWNRDKE